MIGGHFKAFKRTALSDAPPEVVFIVVQPAAQRAEPTPPAAGSLRDDRLEEQQLRHSGLCRCVSVPLCRTVSVGLSGNGSLLHRPGAVMRQQRMEVRPVLRYLLLRPRLRVHPGLLPRL